MHLNLIYKLTVSPLLFRLLIVGLALLGLNSFSTVSVYAASTTLAPNCKAWKIVPGADASSFDFLNGVTAISQSDAWAVGYSSVGSKNLSLIEHWDGSSWSVIPSPSPGSSELYGVAATSHNDVWAVGYGNNFKTLIEHWDGSSWSVIPSPSPAADILTGVAATSHSDAWAVGESNSQSLIEHWDGSSWSIISNPAPGLNNALRGVAATSPSGAWAVGYDVDKNGRALTLVEHWDGVRWSIVPSPNPGTNGNSLASVVYVPGSSQVWAAGSRGNNNGSSASLTEQWNGTSWKFVPSATSGSFYGIAAISPSNIWAVGTILPRALTFTEQWNGTSWKYVHSQNPGSQNFFYGATAVPGTSQVWAVGYYSINNVAKTLIELHC